MRLNLLICRLELPISSTFCCQVISQDHCLLVQEWTAGYTEAMVNHPPSGNSSIQECMLWKVETAYNAAVKCGKSHLATVHFIPKNVKCLAIYPKHKLTLLHATHLPSPALWSQVHFMEVSIILTKWLCWLKLVKGLKYEILILSTNHRAVSKNLLWGITLLFIICLLIYFK